MGALALKILEVLRKLYGSEFVSKTIGTRANVVKPKELDTNAPTKNLYSKDAFRDPKLQGVIDEKIQEYAPFIYSNKNTREQMNFLENAQQLLKQKKRDFGVTDQLQSVGKEKPEADVIDIKTGKKAEGIETLKEDLGLPPEIDPKSATGKALLESKRTFKAMDDEIEENKDELLKSIDAFFGRTKASKDIFMEGKRRAAMRQILLNDKRLNLPEDVEESLRGYKDLQGFSGVPEMDPLTLFDKFYKRDIDKLDVLDDIIDIADNERDAAKKFLQREKFDIKEKDVGDKLKDLPDDIDPDAMATGGRVGFSAGSLTAKGILKLMQSKFGKDTMKMADEIDRPESALNRDMFGEFNERMSRKILDVEKTPPGFKLSRERLLKNFPEIDEDFADEIMTLDRDLQLRVIAMLKDRRKNPEAYDKLLMEMGDTLDFQGEFDRSVRRSKNAGGGLSYLMGM
jgi:hypothetical protein